MQKRQIDGQRVHHATVKRGKKDFLSYAFSLAYGSDPGSV